MSKLDLVLVIAVLIFIFSTVAVNPGAGLILGLVALIKIIPYLCKFNER